MMPAAILLCVYISIFPVKCYNQTTRPVNEVLNFLQTISANPQSAMSLQLVYDEYTYLPTPLLG